MTEAISKPVVKLPRKRQPTADHGVAAASPDSLVSDKLYMDPLPPTVAAGDVLQLLKRCDPIDADMSTGVIQFPSVHMADRAYTLFNGATLADDCRLQLRAHPSGTYGEPEPSSGILSIHNLPQHIDDHRLYEHFRPFGPMALCKIITDQGRFKGTALVQYFRSADADAASAKMNKSNVEGNNINVSPFVSKNMRHHPFNEPDLRSLDMPATNHHTQQQQRPTSMYYGNPPHHHHHHHHHEKPSPNVDYTNLYIKNLDLSVDSPDLFRHFNECGRIISARVMKNAQTKQSKGFGFVSFSKVEEASRALKEKNNTYIRSKPIIVAFHEPKKPRTAAANNNEKSNINGHSLSSPSTLQTTYPPQYRSQDLLRRYSQPGIPPHPPPPYMPVAPPTPEYVPYSAPPPLSAQQPEPAHHHQRVPSSNGNARKPHQNSSAATTKLYRPAMTVQPQPQPQPPSLTTLASGACINNPPVAAPLSQPQLQLQPQPQPQSQPLPPTSAAALGTPQQPATAAPQRPTLRRRGSAESVSSAITETSPGVQKQRLAKAVIKCGEIEHVDDIVDMLLTLKRKERSLCLFNADFLKEKIALAKTALETFQEEEEVKANGRVPPQHPLPTPTAAATTGAAAPLDTRPKSRAIPIVAPAPPSAAGAGAAPAKPTTPNTAGAAAPPASLGPAPSEIDQFLASIANLTVHEQKQKLGDRLFPCVKATGVKHAPRITIRLLDTVPLRILAHSMNDKDALKAKVDAAIAHPS